MLGSRGYTFRYKRPSFLSAAWKKCGLPRGVRKISIIVIHQIVLWYKPTWVFRGWGATETYVRWECASLYLMKYNYLRFRWLWTCHNRYPKTLVSLEWEISSNSLPSMSETGAGQERKGLWREVSWSTSENLGKASLSLRSHWMQHGTDLGSSPLPANSEQASTSRKGSPFIHGTGEKSHAQLPGQGKQPSV